MTSPDEASSFSRHVADSAWVADEPGLAGAITALHEQLGPAHAALAGRAVELAQPGPVDPLRLARHAAAATVSRGLRLATSLPAALSSRRPLTDPRGFLLDSAVEAFVDQLALGGPASAELARLIEGGGALFPAALRAELDRREIVALPVPAPVVEGVLAGAWPGGDQGPRVRLLDDRPITATPVAQLHEAETADGRPVLARVRRPGIARTLDSDSRLAAGVATALQRVAPDVGGMGPLGFVQLVMRQTLESTDLRFEALDLVEAGLILEKSGTTAVVAARPLPDLADRRALVLGHLAGTPIEHHVGPLDDPAGVVAALVSVTLESALVHGVFWADPAPEHLLVLRDGRLALVGVGNLGRFSPELRLAGVRTLKAVLTGDFAGLVEAMDLAGAVGPDVDVAGLLEDLASCAQLNPSTVLLGGERGLLDALSTLVGVLLAHRLQPPVEVTLLLRTVFALGRLVAALNPEGNLGLAAALLPLLPRLPVILAEAEAAVSR